LFVFADMHVCVRACTCSRHSEDESLYAIVDCGSTFINRLAGHCVSPLNGSSHRTIARPTMHQTECTEHVSVMPCLSVALTHSMWSLHVTMY